MNLLPRQIGLPRPVIAGDEALRIALIDRGGEQTTRYTPLALMSLRAQVGADEMLKDRVECRIHAFTNRDSIAAMVSAVSADRPHIVGASCQGWNMVPLQASLHCLRQVLPESFILLGGNHVTDQGNRLLPECPWIDAIVNGEGEVTFCDLLKCLLADQVLDQVQGISFLKDGRVITTPPRARVKSLDEVRSPYLSKALDLSPYDVALIETNRGCPYHCSFCYWGGAVGTRLAKANDLDRVREELVCIGAAKVPSVFVCDANFGILERDVDIAKLVVETFRRYGAPSSFHVNWAKNNADRVGEIVALLRNGGVRTNVYVAIQSLHREALRLADRSELGMQEMLALADKMNRQHCEVGCELIFGLPGESLADFCAAYDTLFLRFPSLLVHPLWILPNSKYDERREQLKLVTLRGDSASDYEGIYQHFTLSADENRDGLALLLADDMLNGSGFAQFTMRGLARFGNLPPIFVLRRFEQFIADCRSCLAGKLRAAFSRIREACYFVRDLRGQIRTALYEDRDRACELLLDFLYGLPLTEPVRAVCGELAKFDCLMLPRADLDGTGPVETVYEAPFDVPWVAALLIGETSYRIDAIEWQPFAIRLRHLAGFPRYAGEAIDLGGVWMGQVTERQRLESEARA